MIKVERITEGTKATIIRKSVSGDVTVNLYPTMLMTHQELATLEIKNGQVTYSIDEEKVVTAYGDKDDNTAKNTTPIADATDSGNIVANDGASSTSGGTDTISNTNDISSDVTNTSTAGTNTPPAKKAGRTVKAK
jgi:hypothetical protein